MKLTYSIVFGILGATLALFLCYILSTVIASILFMSYGDGPWPQWSNIFSNDQILLQILAIFGGVGFIFGAVFGAKYVVTFKKAKQWLLAALLILAILVSLILYRLIVAKHADFLLKQRELTKERVISTAGKIKFLSVIESQENLIFVVSIEASLFGEYELSLAFDTYLAKNFFVYTKKVQIDKRESRLEAIITFSDLKHALREELGAGGRIKSFDQKFGSQDEFLVKVKLRPLEAPIKYEDLKTIKGRMDFICYKDSCEFNKVADKFFQLE